MVGHNFNVGAETPDRLYLACSSCSSLVIAVATLTVVVVVVAAAACGAQTGQIDALQKAMANYDKLNRCAFIQACTQLLDDGDRKWIL